jgi:hypothetical protein
MSIQFCYNAGNKAKNELSLGEPEQSKLAYLKISRARAELYAKLKI